MDKVAIVILNWNGQSMLAQYLPSVMRHSRNEAAVYVADNASTDDSLAYLAQHFPHCQTIALEKNWGFAEGYNKALAQIDAEYYVLLNSDVEVTHQWLTPLIEEMDAHPDIAACQPKLLAMHDRESFEYAGASGGFIDSLGYPYCRGRIFEHVEKDEGQYNYRQEIHWATGACLMVRTKDYWAVGGLDARFFAHNEEIDLCWRLRLRGKKIFCIPESAVYHVGGGTLPKVNPMKTYLNFRNNLTMLYKNLAPSQMRKVMVWRLFLDYVAAFQTLVFNRNWGDFKAIIKARRDFNKWKHSFDTAREEIQNSKTIHAENPNSHFSILWQYYIRSRRTFHTLPQK